jgi:hypothetical protein
VAEDRTSREMHAKHIRVLELSVCCPSIINNSYHLILIISSRSKMNMGAPFQVYATNTTYLRFSEKKTMKKVTKSSLTLC